MGGWGEGDLGLEGGGSKCVCVWWGGGGEGGGEVACCPDENMKMKHKIKVSFIS